MRYLLAGALGVGITCVLLWALRPLAIRIGLVDTPSKRKLHKGNVVLIGGIAIFAALTVSTLALDISAPAFHSFLAAAALLVVVGFLDDLWELPAQIRLAVQITAALIMAVGGGIVVQNLGAITGNHDVTLGAWAIPFTVFATVGVINALNMSDGVDGLAGGLSLIAFLLFGYLALAGGRVADSYVLLLLACIVGTFLLFNLRFARRRRLRSRPSRAKTAAGAPPAMTSTWSNASIAASVRRLVRSMRSSRGRISNSPPKPARSSISTRTGLWKTAIAGSANSPATSRSTRPIVERLDRHAVLR